MAFGNPLWKILQPFSQHVGTLSGFRTPGITADCNSSAIKARKHRPLGPDLHHEHRPLYTETLREMLLGVGGDAKTVEIDDVVKISFIRQVLGQSVK